MGGRGSSWRVTAEQQKVMSRFKKVAQEKGYSNPVFKKANDGFVLFESSKVRTVTKVHVGKMLSPDKDDVYERTETHRGKIGKDGLILRGKTTHEDKLIKRGKR